MKTPALTAWMLLAVLISACQSYPPEVEEALLLSGDNCVELQKVLEHFQDRGQVAYESACFLIGNMKYHNSQLETSITPAHEAYFAQTDSIFEALFGHMTWEEIDRYHNRIHDPMRQALAGRFAALPVVKKDTVPVPDLQVVKAAYLIDHIEQALKVWEEKGYTYADDFDYFKEFILPYRSFREPLKYDRSTQRRLFASMGKDIGLLTPDKATWRLKTYAIRCRWINEFIKPQEHLGIYDLMMPAFQGSCPDLCSWSSNVLRAYGIPTVCEFTPKWRDRDSGHFWCVSPDSTGLLKPYTAPDNGSMGDWQSDIRYAGKVYRSNFGAQKNSPYFLAAKGEPIPSELASPLLSDQTFRYHQTVTLRMPFHEDVGGNVAYLCMFTAQGFPGYAPVGWGRIDRKNDEVVFEQVPINLLFFPVVYKDGQWAVFGEAFMLYAPEPLKDIPLPLTVNSLDHPLEVRLENGRLVERSGEEAVGLHYCTFPCDTNRHTDLHLLRKYPPKRLLVKSLERMKGSYVLGGNQADGDYDTLAWLPSVPIPYLQELDLHNTRKYRYYRYCSADGGPINMAYLEFVGPRSAAHRCSPPSPLPVFSAAEAAEQTDDEGLYRITGTPYYRFLHSNPEHAFDDDIYSFSNSPEVGMDFHTPVQITSIRYIPRIANNGIAPGNTYSLRYYDHGWKEFKKVRAEHEYLDFHEVPVATLYWLHNTSTGKEELPFFYKDGKQYFLHVDEASFSICD